MYKGGFISINLNQSPNGNDICVVAPTRLTHTRLTSGNGVIVLCRYGVHKLYCLILYCIVHCITLF